MKQDFTGVGDDTIVVEFNETLVSGANLVSYVQNTRVDLRPDSLSGDCFICFAVLPPLGTGPYASVNRMGSISCKGKTLLALCRDAVSPFMLQAYGMEVPSLEPKAVFDCKMASYMVMVRQSISGQGAGDVNFMPLDDVEVMGLLNTSPTVKYMIESVVGAYYVSENKQFDMKGYAIALPAFEGRKFYAAPVPADCKTPGGGDGGGGVKPVGDKEETKSAANSWLAPAAVVVGIGGVGALWWAMSRKRKSQLPRAVR